MDETKPTARDAAASHNPWPTILAGGVLAELGLFFGMWLMFDNARMAAGVLVAGHVVAILIGLGAFLSFRATSSTVAHIADALQLQAPAEHAAPSGPSVDGQWRMIGPGAQPQALLPPGLDLQRVADDEFVRREQIERTAIKIYCRLYPHTAPTRENITTTVPGITSHGYITACMNVLRERGVADSAGQGGAWKWVQREDTHSLPAR